MKNFALFPLLLLPFVLSHSCIQTSKGWPCKITTLSASILENAIPLNTIPMGWDDSVFIDAQEFYPLDEDNLLILTEAKTHSAFLYICDLQTHEIKDSLLFKGNGPSEALSCIVISSNPFIFRDYIKGMLYYIDGTSLLQEDRSFHNTSYNSIRPLSTMYPIGEKTLVYEAPYANSYFKQNCAEHYPRLNKSDTEAMPKHTKDMIGIYNVSQGTINVNMKKDRIVYAALNASILELYDLDLNPMSRICGPQKVELRYNVTYEDNGFSGDVPFSYLDICTTSDYFYVSYSGSVLDDTGHDIFLDKGYILQYTWDGELVNCYSVNHLPSSIYIRSEADKTIYVTMKDGKDKLALYSCQLP